MATNQMEKVVKLYKLLAQNPSLTGARILEANKNAISVMSLWNQRNLERKANQRFLQEYTLDESLKVIKESFPIDITTELISTFTRDGQQRAVLRQASIDNSTKQFIEIWRKQRLIKNYDLAALDVHGEVYTDSEFGSFEWSPDGKKLLYIAEKKLPKSEPFYKQKNPDKNKEKNNEDKEKAPAGNEYVYKPHWGEQLVGKHHPVIAVLDIDQDTITVLSGVPDDISPGQVIWTLDGQHVVGVAWKHEPRHLGLIFCSNRDSWIFILKDGNYQKLSQDQCAVHSPRFSPDGKQLIWLEREAGGPHHNCHRLMRMRFDSDEQKREVMIDIVKTSQPITNGKQFRGLYGRLPKNCWSSDSKYIFLSTPQETNIRSYIVDADTSNITEIQNDSSSLNVLDIRENVIVFLKVSLVEPWSLVVGSFNSQSLTDGNIKMVQITRPMKITGFEEFIYESTVHHYENEEEIKTFNFIYFGPKSGADKSIPLVITPHGGPHSNFANTFSLELSLFALLGFAVVQVNFRGSTGMGSNTVEYLQGKVGTADVQDCVTATKEALKKYSWLDPERIVLCGGSHGGFLVAHLSGQYPDLYKAVAARNPVIDIAAMFTISDIPDWCAAEINVPYVEGSQQPEKLSDIEIALKMLKYSPIIHVSKVKAPTLLCIGSNDLRVPPSQGKMWYHRLKANNVKTRMLIYEDNHSLGSGNAEIDHIINTSLWFMENLSMNENSE